MASVQRTCFFELWKLLNLYTKYGLRVQQRQTPKWCLKKDLITASVFSPPEYDEEGDNDDNAEHHDDEDDADDESEAEERTRTRTTMTTIMITTTMTTAPTTVLVVDINAIIA